MKSLTGSGSFYPYTGLKIDYPGYKGKGDYRLTKSGIAPTHAQLAEELYNLIRTKIFTYDELKNFLIDIYDNGTNTNYTNSQLEELKNSIFWITL